MNSIYRLLFICFVSTALFIGCASKRKKGGNPSKLSKFYHNTTALYNGYFNANELMKDSYLSLRQAHRDNYNEILPLYDYVSVENTKSVATDLDKAIEKVTTVASLHEPSKWVDDCYVMLGEAQYLKQDFESAEETFVYFKDEFNPRNPFGRNYKKKKRSKKSIKKEKDKERKIEKEAREKKKKEEQEAKDKARKDKKKEQDAADKAKKKEREQTKKERERKRKEEAARKKKEREAEKKRKEKEKKRRKKGKKRRPAKKDKVEDKKVEDKNEEILKEETKPIAETKPVKEEKEIVPDKKEVREENEDRGEDEEDYSDSKKKKKVEKKKDKTAYSKGMMWYAKTLVQRDKYSTASYLIKRMMSDGTMPKDALREAPVILADINIKEKNYYSAIENLEQAIEFANDKGLKARYSFVKGQLHLINKEYAEGSEAFVNAKKWAKSFEMEFMAELNMEKTQMMGGAKTNERVLGKLDKMIKEDKYEEYLDQLYFTNGEIQLETGSFEEALKSFTLSIKNNVNNISLKQETYYKLAYLFYDKEEYVNAKSYFDSTVQVLDKEDARYNESSRYASNLSGIAQNIASINLHDSLLNMVAWSDEKIETLAEKLVQEGRSAKSSGGSAPSTRKSKGLLSGVKASLKKSNFFAYNKQGRDRGKKQFEEAWGDIVLEDNWRRKDKSGIFGADEEVLTEKTPEDGFEEDKIGKMIAQIKSQIPYSDEAKDGLNSALKTAFFELGKAYRDKIQNYKKAAETHEELLRRFPNFERKMDVYYYLYLAYLDLNNSSKAEFYKDKVINEFPNSEFAKAISDPNYRKDKLSKEEQLGKYYEETYVLFESGNYKEAYDQADQSENIFGKKNKLRPKFALIKAMATGSVEGKPAYIKALRDVILRFPNTPEKARADEILRFLQGDKDAFTGIDIEEVDEIFSVEDDKLHYVAVVMYDITPDKMVNSKISISNYNKKYHKLKKLQLSESPLDRKKKTEIILVRKFENKEKAMTYYKEVNKSKDEFVTEENSGFSIYAVSQRNYRKMIIDKSDARYRVFFGKHYLGK